MMGEWLSLTEAAKVLGVHPSTVRRWSDDGKIPFVRTQGGHRRFERVLLEQYLVEQQAQTQMPLSPLPDPTHSPIWQQTFRGQTLEEVRQLGQRLLGLMLQYVTRQSEDERFLAESRAVGRVYGRETAQAGLAMLDMVEAFLYFRSRFTEITIHLPAFPREGDDAEMRRLHGRIDRFMNEVLLGAIEGHEEHPD